MNKLFEYVKFPLPSSSTIRRNLLGSYINEIKQQNILKLVSVRFFFYSR